MYLKLQCIVVFQLPLEQVRFYLSLYERRVLSIEALFSFSERLQHGLWQKLVIAGHGALRML